MNTDGQGTRVQRESLLTEQSRAGLAFCGAAIPTTAYRELCHDRNNSWSSASQEPISARLPRSEEVDFGAEDPTNQGEPSGFARKCNLAEASKSGELSHPLIDKYHADQNENAGNVRGPSCCIILS